MVIKQAAKINHASLQVLKTLQALLKDNYTMSELVEVLNSKEETPVFNSNIVSKYINSCRYCGIEIPKIHNKYYVASLPFGLNLTFKDIVLLENLQTTANNLFSKKFNLAFDAFLNKLNKFSNKKIANVQNKNQEDIYKVFQLAIEQNRQICLMLRTKEIYICSPIEIVKNNNKAFFNVYTQNQEKLISLDRVTGIEVSDKKSTYKTENVEVIFKVTGKLAERYTLKDGETVKDFGAGFKTISNIGENKEILFTRLLRYDSCCEILKPEEYRKEFGKIIKNTLLNYGVE